MKLDAFDLHGPMTESHDDSVSRLRRDFQTIRQAVFFNDQRMITTRGQVLIESRKQSAAVVLDRRRLAVEEFRRARHASAKGLSNRLMTQTDAENRSRAAKRLDDIHRYAGVVGCSRSGRNHNSIGLQFDDLIDRDFVITTHLDSLAQFTEILNQVESKRIVVVDD